MVILVGSHGVETYGVDGITIGTYAPSHDVTLSNITLSNGAWVHEAYCDWNNQGDVHNRAVNITGGTVDMCY